MAAAASKSTLLFSDDEEDPPIDLSVEVEDARGRTARIRLGDYGPIRRPLVTHILRRRDLEERRFDQPWELILQTYSIPLGDFGAILPDLDLASLKAVRLVFDRTQAGEVVVDQIGFSALDPHFLGARLEGPAR